MQDITSEEFYVIAEQVKNTSRGRKLSAESVKLVSLKKGEGFMCPCRWVHGAACRGLNAMHVVARRNGGRITARCMEKNLYVLRTG